MLAYAADTPRPAGRAGSPKALTIIVAGHLAVIAAVLAAKPELVIRDDFPVIKLLPIPADPPPPEPADPTPPRVETQAPETVIQDPVIEQVKPIIDMGTSKPIEIATGPVYPPLPPVRDPVVLDPPKHVPVKLGPRFATNENAVKPPYPLDKIRDEAEATLKLRLTIDGRGRVTAVDPVGFADPSFLEAARRHILRAWRYKPATEDGVGVASSIVINLSFRLEDV